MKAENKKNKNNQQFPYILCVRSLETDKKKHLGNCEFASLCKVENLFKVP